jgi:hypothetical protein
MGRRTQKTWRRVRSDGIGDPRDFGDDRDTNSRASARAASCPSRLLAMTAALLCAAAKETDRSQQKMARLKTAVAASAFSFSAAGLGRRRCRPAPVVPFFVWRLPRPELWAAKLAGAVGLNCQPTSRWMANCSADGMAAELFFAFGEAAEQINAREGENVENRD